jgi:hypothetical protein
VERTKLLNLGPPLIEDGLIEYEQGMTTCMYFRINYIIQSDIEWFTLPIVDTPSIPRLTDTSKSAKNILDAGLPLCLAFPHARCPYFCKFCSMKTLLQPWYIPRMPGNERPRTTCAAKALEIHLSRMLYMSLS